MNDMKKMTIEDGKTMDIVADNIEQLKTIFPEVFSEDKIDFERLQSLLGDYVNKDEEHYNFTWHGKKQAQMIAQTPSTGTLRPAKSESKNWDETQNLVIEGDNLEVLKLLQKSYHRKVKIIYIDPPYNTGKDFVYKDNFKDNIKNYQELTGQTDNEGKKLSTNTESNGRYHTDWLNMMYPRLKLARNLLTDDGVIFISIDDNEQANLKKLCDDIFGEENLLMSCTWRKTDNQANIGTVARVKEYILGYSKNMNELKLFKMPLSDKAKQEYRYEDKNGLFRRSILLDKTRGRHFYDLVTPSGKVLKGPWMKKHEDILKMDLEGKIYWTSGGEEQPYGKLYLHDSEGQIPNDFLGIEYGTNQRGSLEVEKLLNGRLFDFPKPHTLVKHFVNLGAKSKDLVLDFFGGSGTTAHAVMQLNAEDGGNRRCISVQLPELTEEKSEAYKAGYKNIADITKERIRRAGAKIVEDNKDKEGIENLDTGFKVFKLDTSNIKTWDSSAENFDPENLKAGLFDAIENIKTDRSQEDVLYELLIKTGIDLSVPMQIYVVEGKIVYSMGLGTLIVCLDKGIDNNVITGITKLVEELSPQSTKVIFKDDSFVNDVVKTNALQTLKRHNITDVQSL